MYDAREELYKPIAGYDGRYEVNIYGCIRRVGNGKVRMLHPYMNRGQRFIKLSLNRKSKVHKVSRLVAAAFMPPPCDGMRLYHINGVSSDDFIGNLKWADPRWIGRQAALLSGRRKPIVKVDQDGQAVAFYASARAAALANHMSDQAVLNRCHGKVKRPYALDGHDYRFEEDWHDQD